MTYHMKRVALVRDFITVPRLPVVVALFALCGPFGSAFSAQPTITLAYALEQTLQHNSELKAYPYQQQIIAAEKQQAGLTPNPTLGLEVENAFGDGERTGLSRADITLTLGQTIELGDKRQHRLALTDANSANQSARYTMTRLNVLAETSRRYYQVLYLQSLADLVAQRITQEKAALSVIQRRARAGAVGQADVSKMALRLAESQASYQQTQSQHRLAKARLAAMWMAESDFQSVAGDLSHWPTIPDSATLTSVVRQTPIWLLQQARQQLADRQLQLARANGVSDVNFGIGFRRFSATDDQALTFSVSMPLALSNPNSGNIAAAEVQRQQQYQQSDFVVAETTLALEQIQQQLMMDTAYEHTLSDDLLPAAEQLLKETQKGYRNGSYSVIQWVDAQMQLFRLQQQRLTTQTAIFLQLLELERMTGQQLTTGNDNAGLAGATYHDK